MCVFFPETISTHRNFIRQKELQIKHKVNAHGAISISKRREEQNRIEVGRKKITINATLLLINFCSILRKSIKFDEKKNSRI